MLNGRTPFYAKSSVLLEENICKRRPGFDNEFDKEAKSFIEALLQKDPSKRMQGKEEISQHPWLKDINWDEIYNQTVTAPFIPSIDSPNDTKHFSHQFTNLGTLDYLRKRP
jgi:serine/threonine protein kinase